MTQYYWAEGVDDYSADNEANYNKIIEIKRLNFFIGRNNAGKSKFLRELFKSKSELKDHHKIDIDDILQKIERSIRQISATSTFILFDINHRMADAITSEDVKTFLSQHLNNIKDLYPSAFTQKKFETEIDELHRVRRNDRKVIEDGLIDLYRNRCPNLFADSGSTKKHYIPILRGMRPTSGKIGSTPYIDRTRKDYFDEKIEKSTILTGESLYEELSRCLLGEPHEREIIREYEQKLSQYFFDGQPISLIPKYKNDVVYIKIGKDKQLPIYELGDGLQQAIILTYEAFIKKDEVHAFFIEEPELHMHAGMVRQLMNFYLNETKHYYFFTTHSNHLLDMVDESDEVIIQKFSKTEDGKFLINRCDKDRDLLASLGVKPSSVYLVNCTIWVEGITDRLYLIKYMEKYLKDVANSEQQTKYKRFMPSYHYTFVEYQGGNLVHWNFDNLYKDHIDQINAKSLNNEILLIADGDIKGKADRENILRKLFKKECLEILNCKETENTLPFNLIIEAAKNRFANMQKKTKSGFDITKLDMINDENIFYTHTDGIGRILDSTVRNTRTNAEKYAFSEPSGTIKKKLEFCRDILKLMDTKEWQLTDSAKELCEKIFQHIQRCNK